LAIVAVPIVYYIRFDALRSIVPIPAPVAASYYGAAAFPLAAGLILVFIATGVYQDRQRSWFVDELFAVWRAVLVASIVVLAMTSLYRDPILNYSRLTFGLWLVTASLLIGFGRYGIRSYERGQLAKGTGVLNAVVVGYGAPARLLIDRVHMFPDCGYRIVGSVTRNGHPEARGVRHLGQTHEIRQIVVNNAVDVVFIADPDATQSEIVQLGETLADLSTEFRIVPGILDIIASSKATHELMGIPLLSLKRGLDRDQIQWVAKRAIDVVLSAAGLIVLSPAMVFIGGLVRLTSPGPAMIHQERVGLQGKRFQMYKFRSMRTDAEDKSGPVWATPGDPRRTRVGTFLRRFSLDEFPQLWNVFAGDMSLVGPRPERPLFVEQFTSEVANYGERIRLRPGLTGWAQVNDIRGMTSVEERLLYDLYYLEHWSIALDLKIILTTAFRVATHRNAS
jgi:exopolysaccharide biosynthesis polyprenyl glycosylphosphotransferase